MVEGKQDTILSFRQQNDLTRPMRNAAGQQGVRRIHFAMAGQGVARSRELPAADLVKTLVEESSALKIARA